MNAAPAQLSVTVQTALEPRPAELPAATTVTAWVAAALAGADFAQTAVVTVRFVAADEGAELNSQYRDKAGPTNVLAFAAAPAFAGAVMDETELGDLVICWPVAQSEAGAQGKGLVAHLAHLTIHGTLHLLGYDHGNDAEAGVMEGLEQRVMATLQLPNPYAGDA